MAGTGAAAFRAGAAARAQRGNGRRGTCIQGNITAICTSAAVGCNSIVSAAADPANGSARAHITATRCIPVNGARTGSIQCGGGAITQQGAVCAYRRRRRCVAGINGYNIALPAAATRAGYRVITSAADTADTVPGTQVAVC